MIFESISSKVIDDYNSKRDMYLSHFQKIKLTDAILQIYKSQYSQLSHVRINKDTKGYVWLDDNAGKTNVRNNLYDQGSEKGINGITVYLKNSAGQTVKTTTTSELGLYSEIEGGEYQFTDVDLDALPGYYIEYEYCGITYQSVDKNLETKNGSKAIDTNSRNILDNKFSSVDGNSSQNLNVNGVNVNYNRVNGQYKSEISGHSGCNVSARTDEAGYNLYSDFEPTMEEIRYINLGLFEKEQTDYLQIPRTANPTRRSADVHALPALAAPSPASHRQAASCDGRNAGFPCPGLSVSLCG